VKYTCVIESRALNTVLACPAKERRMIADIFTQLEESYFIEPDLREMIEGHEVLVRFFGSITITYLLDHAVKEVRVIHVLRD
jgi:hypothetical protein